jgi:catechol 2,3-dioxygenase-like lactoylglutathione lyase family enzyme
MNIRGTDFIYYQTNVIDKAIAFYRDTLGLGDVRSFRGDEVGLVQRRQRLSPSTTLPPPTRT